MPLEIRTFQPGDEEKQAAIYNTVAAALPGFKRATIEDVRRRTKAKDFDPATRFYAVTGGEVVGYATIQANGRIGYPWSLPGHAAEVPLFDAAVAACRRRGIKRIFTAYRADWTAQAAFFEARGFRKAREMVNFVQNLIDLPTMIVRRGLSISPMTPGDAPAIAALAPNVIRVTAEQLARYLLENPYFSQESVFVLRRADNAPQAIGILIENSEYAKPTQVDVMAPCFRLGAFGTEGMSTKRINGLFSFLARDDSNAAPLGLDLLSHAIDRLNDETIDCFAAQVPSDAPHLLGFYQKYFRKQGSFPIYELDLS
jgi:hypothetical protein